MAPLLRGKIRRATIEPASQVVGHEQGNSRPASILSKDQFNNTAAPVVVPLNHFLAPGERKSILPSGPAGEHAEALPDSPKPTKSGFVLFLQPTLSTQSDPASGHAPVRQAPTVIREPRKAATFTRMETTPIRLPSTIPGSAGPPAPQGPAWKQ